MQFEVFVFNRNWSPMGSRQLLRISVPHQIQLLPFRNCFQKNDFVVRCALSLSLNVCHFYASYLRIMFNDMVNGLEHLVVYLKPKRFLLWKLFMIHGTRILSMTLYFVCLCWATFFNSVSTKMMRILCLQYIRTFVMVTFRSHLHIWSHSSVDLGIKQMYHNQSLLLNEKKLLSL